MTWWLRITVVKSGTGSNISMRLARVLSVLAMGSLLPLAGCAVVARQAFSEFRGARGEVLLNQQLPILALEEYESVRFSPSTTALSSLLCDPEVPAIYDRHARELERELQEAFPGEPPPLVIDTEILYVKKKDLLNNAQLLARLHMRSNERVVVDALLNVQSEAFGKGDAGAMTKAAFEAINSFLLEHKRDVEYEGLDR
jgi:hypothetical protein